MSPRWHRSERSDSTTSVLRERFGLVSLSLWWLVSDRVHEGGKDVRVDGRLPHQPPESVQGLPQTPRSPTVYPQNLSTQGSYFHTDTQTDPNFGRPGKDLY